MIYQHVPRMTRDGYVRNRCRDLAALTHVRPDSITENEIEFLLLTKNPRYKTPSAPCRRSTRTAILR